MLSYKAVSMDVRHEMSPRTKTAKQKRQFWNTYVRLQAVGKPILVKIVNVPDLHFDCEYLKNSDG